jgi:hypothetical protein
LLLEVVLVETITDLSLGTEVVLVEALATLQMALLEELVKATEAGTMLVEQKQGVGEEVLAVLVPTEMVEILETMVEAV